MKTQLIKEVDWGIACKVGNIIYLNKNLDKHPDLKKAILNHEREHSDSYELKDVWIDLKGKHLKEVKKEYYLFILRYPKSIITFLPIWKYEDKLVIDPIMSFIWLFGLGFLSLLKTLA